MVVRVGVLSIDKVVAHFIKQWTRKMKVPVTARKTNGLQIVNPFQPEPVVNSRAAKRRRRRDSHEVGIFRGATDDTFGGTVLRPECGDHFLGTHQTCYQFPSKDLIEGGNRPN